MQRNVLLGAVLTGLALCAAAFPAAAESLAEVVAKVEGNPTRNPPCTEIVLDPAVPGVRPFGRCAVNIVGSLYLGLLRDRERLAVLRDAIAQQRQVLAAQQRYVEGGGSSESDLLLAEVELKRWQLREAELVGAVLHAELFFATTMESDPEAFARPSLDPEAWPESEATALAALAQYDKLPEDERQALELTLQHAWIDYRAARRTLDLLEPMQAFTHDIAQASMQKYEIAQLSFPTLLNFLRENSNLRERLVVTQYRALALQFHILELLQRREALQ